LPHNYDFLFQETFSSENLETAEWPLHLLETSHFNSGLPTVQKLLLLTFP